MARCEWTEILPFITNQGLVAEVTVERPCGVKLTRNSAGPRSGGAPATARRDMMLRV
jgi:hypothetical protein